MAAERAGAQPEARGDVSFASLYLCCRTQDRLTKWTNASTGGSFAKFEFVGLLQCVMAAALFRVSVCVCVCVCACV